MWCVLLAWMSRPIVVLACISTKFLSTVTFGYGNVLGMHAFGLVENGSYALAEEKADVALAMQSTDIWAAHAMAHVYEMEVRYRDVCVFFFFLSILLSARLVSWIVGVPFLSRVHAVTKHQRHISPVNALCSACCVCCSLEGVGGLRPAPRSRTVVKRSTPGKHEYLPLPSVVLERSLFHRCTPVLSPAQSTHTPGEGKRGSAPVRLRHATAKRTPPIDSRPPLPSRKTPGQGERGLLLPDGLQGRVGGQGRTAAAAHGVAPGSVFAGAGARVPRNSGVRHPARPSKGKFGCESRADGQSRVCQPDSSFFFGALRAGTGGDQPVTELGFLVWC